MSTNPSLYSRLGHSGRREASTTCACGLPDQVSADLPRPLPQTSRRIEALATATSTIRSQFPSPEPRSFHMSHPFLTPQNTTSTSCPAAVPLTGHSTQFYIIYHRPITFCSPPPKSAMPHEAARRFLDNLERANGREPIARSEATVGRLRPASPAPRVSPEHSSSPSSSSSSLPSPSLDVGVQNKTLRELLTPGWSFNDLAKAPPPRYPEDYEGTLKLVIVGETWVGKSSCEFFFFLFISLLCWLLWGTHWSLGPFGCCFAAECVEVLRWMMGLWSSEIDTHANGVVVIDSASEILRRQAWTEVGPDHGS